MNKKKTTEDLKFSTFPQPDDPFSTEFVRLVFPHGFDSCPQFVKGANDEQKHGEQPYQWTKWEGRRTGEEQTHFKEMEVAVAGKFSRLDHVAVDRPELLTGGEPG